MSIYTLSYCIDHGFTNRKCIVRINFDANQNLKTMDPNNLVFSRHDIRDWREERVLLAILDDGEDITFEMLQQKQLELEQKEAWKLLRQLRNQLISDTDYLLMIDYPISAEKLEEWKVYRQALRDLPSTSNPTLDERGKLDMTSFVLPEKPNL
jgi:hypothetical protein